MTKITKLGLSAMVALAMMLTTSVGVVAQEKVVASTDNVEVKESVETKIGLATKLANNVKPTIQQREKVMTIESRLLADTWVSTDQTSSTPIDFEITAINVSPPDPGSGVGCRTANPGNMCSALLQYDPNEIPDPTVLIGLDFSAAKSLYPSLNYTTVGKYQ